MAFTRTELKLKSGKIACHVGGSGRPVVYLHSAGGVRLSPALERIAQSHKLYLPVLPGFDGTPKNDKLKSMADLADLAAEVIESEIKGPCDVIGHSFGGWTATWLAARHPDKVQQLVLAAPAGFRPEGKGGLVSDPATLRKMMFAHPENLPPEQKPAEVLAQNRAMVHHYHGETSMDRDLVGRLKDIQTLTLILYGTKDGVIPLDSVHLLKERLAHSFLVYVYDAAHALDIDQPDRYAKLITDFLARGEAFIVNWGNGAAA